MRRSSILFVSTLIVSVLLLSAGRDVLSVNPPSSPTARNRQHREPHKEAGDRRDRATTPILSPHPFVARAQSDTGPQRHLTFREPEQWCERLWLPIHDRFSEAFDPTSW